MSNDNIWSSHVNIDEEPYSLIGDNQWRYIATRLENPDFNKLQAAEHVGLRPKTVYGWPDYVEDTVKFLRQFQVQRSIDEAQTRAAYEREIVLNVNKELLHRLKQTPESFSDRELLTLSRDLTRIYLARLTNEELSSDSKRTASPRMRWKVLDRDGFTCIYCGSSSVDDNAELHVDHIIPWSHGGETVYANLVTACVDCNLGKSARIIQNQSRRDIIKEVSRRNKLYGLVNEEGDEDTGEY